MNMDYVSIGRNPPEEVNAIIEVDAGPARPSRVTRTRRTL